MDLVELLKRPEGKTLEFKRDLSTPEGALKTIVAFANTAGGALLVGVEDKSRHVRGVRDPLDLEERLANLISDHIVPRGSSGDRGADRAGEADARGGPAR
jgi:predicted HTH transcriptional regulator